MSLMQMSFSGAFMILAIIIVRAIAINKLPKRLFLILWEIVLLRLLIPVSIPSILSAYSFVSKNKPIQDMLAETPMSNIIPQETMGQFDITTDTTQALQNGISVWFLVWLTGMILCAAFFMISYIRCYLEFRTSLPVNNEIVSEWLQKHPLKRPVKVRQSGRISAPLTYGIFRPVILMPKNIDWENKQQLEYIFLHEYTHICHYDTVLKLIATLTLCIHWFNPMVWIMYILFNRDIELVCDECVIKQSGEDSKASYALTLIAMEEKKNSFTPLCNSFSKNVIEERITAIMKVRRITLWTIIVSAGILIVIVVLFATSTKKESVSQISNEEVNWEVPNIVKEAAMELVEQKYTSMQDANYSNWRIESLAHVYTYEDIEGMMLQIYQLNYEFWTDEPENITLAGSMTIDEDGWVVPEYANSTFLIFQQDGNSLSYLNYIMENDCEPGDEIFTNDLIYRLNNK